MHVQYVPSCFLARTTGLLQGLWDGSILPVAIIILPANDWWLYAVRVVLNEEAVSLAYNHWCRLQNLRDPTFRNQSFLLQICPQIPLSGTKTALFGLPKALLGHLAILTSTFRPPFASLFRHWFVNNWRWVRDTGWILVWFQWNKEVIPTADRIIFSNRKVCP